MNNLTVKYWEGRTPPPGYYAPVDPYTDSPQCKYNLREMVQFALRKGKAPSELTFEEVEQFYIKQR